LPIDPGEVSAVLVTRGNVDLSPVLDSLIFEDVVVWSNNGSVGDPRPHVRWCATGDEMTYGRALAVACAKHDVIYSQDDDVIHTPEDQARIVSEYRPGVLTGCMWPEWSDAAAAQGIPDGYSDLVFAGSGSVYDFDVPANAIARYREEFLMDDFFRLWCDTIVGVIAPTRQLDIRFEALPTADDDYRMANQPGFTEQKREAIRRARLVRDRERVWA
jgi:hypothetical protein